MMKKANENFDGDFDLMPHPLAMLRDESGICGEALTAVVAYLMERRRKRLVEQAALKDEDSGDCNEEASD